VYCVNRRRRGFVALQHKKSRAGFQQHGDVAGFRRRRVSFISAKGGAAQHRRPCVANEAAMIFRMLLVPAALVSLAMPASAFQEESSWAPAEALEPARASAPTVVIAFIHSARQPRGSWGECPADGRVVEVERGGGLAFGDKVSVSVPCAAGPREGQFPRPVRRIAMAHLWDGTYARLYFTAERDLVDYQPLRLSPAPTPPFWSSAGRNN
jgi:hypothetical protein